MSDTENWVLTFHDGSTEKRRGTLQIREGVLYVEVRSGGFGGYLHEQYAYPLTSLRKWQVKR